MNENQNLNQKLTDAELETVSGGYTFTPDVMNSYMTIVLDEGETAAAALADLPNQLKKISSLLKLSAAAQTKLTDEIVPKMYPATDKRQLDVKYSFSGMQVNIVSYEIN